MKNNNKYKNIFNKNISSINNKMTKKKEEEKNKTKYINKDNKIKIDTNQSKIEDKSFSYEKSDNIKSNNLSK